MPDDIGATITGEIFDAQAEIRPDFLRATFSGSRPGAKLAWTKVVLRPVTIKGARVAQFSYYDEKRCITKNYQGEDLSARLEELKALPFRNVNIATAGGETHITFAKDGTVSIRRGKVSAPGEAPPLAHDRQKSLLLPDGRPDPFLQAIGFMTADGRVKADRQHKFKQINEFLKLIEQTGEIEKIESRPVEVVDFGCGNAYLTFAVFYYLNHLRMIPSRMAGVDVRGDLLEKHARTVQELEWSGLTFHRTGIAAYKPESPPDIALALHACDTATDEAIAQGIRWNSRLIISVPCCHHQLQEQLSRAATPEPFRPVSRHGILMERMGDVLTDAFRASILRIMGYQTDVIQFISSEHTAKNLMIRSVKSESAAPSHLIREYLAMKKFWAVTPYLEQILGETLAGRLTRIGDA